MKKLPRSKKIDIRINPLFIELLQRIQRERPELSRSDILCMSLGKFVADDWRFHADEKMFNLAQAIQDVNHVKNRSKHGTKQIF